MKLKNFLFFFKSSLFLSIFFVIYFWILLFVFLYTQKIAFCQWEMKKKIMKKFLLRSKFLRQSVFLYLLLNGGIFEKILP
jgi:hypothetical protein